MDHRTTQPMPSMSRSLACRRAKAEDAWRPELGARLVEQLRELDVKKFELVVVNLYPFTETLASGAPAAEVIEQIDIGLNNGIDISMNTNMGGSEMSYCLFVMFLFFSSSFV